MRWAGAPFVMASITKALPAGGPDLEPGDVAWSNHSNTGSSNDTYATVTLSSGQNSKVLIATSITWNIPSTATINGVSASIERKKSADPDTIFDLTIKLYRGDTTSLTGNNKSAGAAWPTTDTTVNHGGASDLWGATLTPAIINHANGFGLGLACESTLGGGTASVDYIEMTITYTTDPALDFPHTDPILKRRQQRSVVTF